MERSLAKLMTLLMMTLAVLVTVGCSEDDTVAGADDEGLTTEDVSVITEDFATTLADDQEGILTDYTSFDIATGGSKTTYTIADTGQQNRGNLSITRIRVFYDSEGNESDSYDPQTTVAMDKLLHIEGTRTNMLGTRTSSILHDDSLRIDDIAPTDSVRTLNGLGSREVTSSFESIDTSMAMSTQSFQGAYSLSIVDLQLKRGEVYPLEGEIEVDASRIRTVTVDGVERTVTVELSFVVTFDGTNVATVTLSDGTILYIDLDEARPYRIDPRQ